MPRSTFHSGNIGPLPIPPAPARADAQSTPDVPSHPNATASVTAENMPWEVKASDMFAHIAESLAAVVISAIEQLEHDDFQEASIEEIRQNLRRLSTLWWAFSPLLGRSRMREDRSRLRMLSRVIGNARGWDLRSADVVPLFCDSGHSLACFVSLESIRMRVGRQLLQACKDVHFQQTLRKIVDQAVADIKRVDSPRYSSFIRARLDVAGERLSRLVSVVAAERRLREDDIRRIRRAVRRIGELNDCIDLVG